jgi:two-component system cell cycle sensor histidine kinase/response regulator CckA
MSAGLAKQLHMDGTVKHPATVLVVDDEPGIREVMALALIAGGHQCIAAADGAEALAEVVKHHEIQGVITDLHMPKMDGLALLRRLREERPELPVVVCSGSISDECRHELADLGVTSILRKPYTAKQLLQCVEPMTHPAPMAA